MVVDHKIGTVVRSEDHKTGSLPSVTREYLPCLWQIEEKRALTHGGVQQIILRLCELARITDTRGSPHTFRHTSAMLHLKNGASIFDLKAKLGHSKVETTQRYLNSYTSDVSLETLRKYSPVDNL